MGLDSTADWGWRLNSSFNQKKCVSTSLIQCWHDFWPKTFLEWQVDLGLRGSLLSGAWDSRFSLREVVQVTLSNLQNGDIYANLVLGTLRSNEAKCCARDLISSPEWALLCSEFVAWKLRRSTSSSVAERRFWDSIIKRLPRPVFCLRQDVLFLFPSQHV